MLGIMKFDLVYKEIGNLGLYQKYIVVLTGINSAYIGFLFLSSFFLLSVPEHRCAIPGLPNDTYAVQGQYHQQLINQTIPQGDACHVFSPSIAYDSENRPINASVLSCNQWVYDDSVFEATLAAKHFADNLFSFGFMPLQLNIVCDKKIYRSNAQMIFFAGVLTGSFVTGLLSDRFGRRPVCCLFTTLLIGAAFAIAWTPSYVYYVIFSYLVGTLAVGNFMPCYVLGIEFVGPPKRKFAGVMGSYSWTIGLLLLAWMGYSIRHWFYLQLACSLPGLIFLLYWWLLPESPRWLFSRGRLEESEKIIKTIAKYNKTTLPDDFLKKISQEGLDEPTETLWHMFSTKRLTVRTLVIFINWIVVCMSYYGLALNSGNLGGDVFLNFALNALMDLPATILVLILVDRTGRRPLHVTCMIIGGVACLSTIFSTEYGGNDFQWLTTTLAMIGKIGAMAAFTLIYIYSAELYPTIVRNAGMGASSCMARVGAMVAPYIADLGTLVNSGFGKALPMIVFGSLSVFAGLLVLLLPETLNMHLPETIEDAQQFGREDYQFEDCEKNGKINEVFAGSSGSLWKWKVETKM